MVGHGTRTSMDETRREAEAAMEREEYPGRGLDHLYRFAGAIGTALDMSTLVDDALRPLLAMGQADKLLVALVGKEGAERMEIRRLGWDRNGDIDLGPAELTALGTDAAGYARTADLPPALRKLFSDTEGSWILVPLSAYGRKLGFLVLARSGPPFPSSTVELLNTAGRQFALSFENARLFSDLQRSYNQLVETQEQLIRSERLAALGALAATMAHEIRNPLATIFASLSQIRRHSKLSEDAQTLLEIAEEEALRLNQMVAGLLEFARPRAPRREEARPAEIVEELLRSLREGGSVPEGVALGLEPGAEDLIAELDPVLFKQAVANLVANALFAVQSGKGDIRVAIEKTKDNRDDLAVTVSDNGPGINPDVKHRIFEPFFSTKPSGIGLGLPLVKRIVEDHNGHVEVESFPGGGTRVRMVFRAVPAR